MAGDDLKNLCLSRNNFSQITILFDPPQSDSSSADSPAPDHQRDYSVGQQVGTGNSGQGLGGNIETGDGLGGRLKNIKLCQFQIHKKTEEESKPYQMSAGNQVND